MKIEYMGHSSFVIYGDKISLVTDPFDGIGYSEKPVRADVCISSHAHFDHCFFKATDCTTYFKGGATVGGGISVSGKGDADAVKDLLALRYFSAFHDDAHGKKRGTVTVFSFVVDGVEFCHAGDIGQPDDDDFIKNIHNPDVLFIPVGGNYTIDAAAAYRYALRSRAKIILPMHYKTQKCKLDIDGKQAFLKMFDRVEIKNNPFIVTRENLPAVQTALDIKFND